MNDFADETVPDRILDQETSDAMLKKAEWKKHTGQPPAPPLSISGLEKMSFDSSIITVVPRAAEPELDSVLKLSVQPTINELEADQTARDNVGIDGLKVTDDVSKAPSISDEDISEVKKRRSRLFFGSKHPTTPEILRSLSDEYRVAGDEALRNEDFTAAEEAFTKSINVCVKPTKEAVMEFKARTCSQESEPFGFLGRLGLSPDAILPEADIYNCRAFVRIKLGLLLEAREDCIMALHVLEKLEREGEEEADAKTYVSAISQKISIERKMGHLEEAASSLNDLFNRMEETGAFQTQIFDFHEALRTYRIVEREIDEADEERRIDMRLVKRELVPMTNILLSLLSMIAKEQEQKGKFDEKGPMAGHISASVVEAMTSMDTAIAFRMSQGFELLLAEDVINPVTLPLILPIITAAVISGLSPQHSTSINAREVTRRIDVIMTAFLETPEQERQKSLKLVIRLFGVCSQDFYFLDYITRSPFLLTPDFSEAWRNLLLEMFSSLQKDGQVEEDRLHIAAHVLAFIVAVIRHRSYGPRAAFDAWGISISSFLRVAQDFIGSTQEIHNLSLGVDDFILGQLACRALDEILGARKYSVAKVSRQEILTTGCEVIRVMRRILRGKTCLRSDIQHQLHIHRLKASLYPTLYNIIRELGKSDIEAFTEVNIPRLLFEALRDIREVDPGLERSANHIKWIFMSCSDLLLDHRAEVFDQLQTNWADIFLSGMLKLAFDKFVNEKASDAIDLMCGAAANLLAAWLEDGEGNAERWGRGEGAFVILSQVLNETARRRANTSKQLLAGLGADIVLCIGLCARTWDHAKALYDLGVMDTLICMMRTERARGAELLHKNLSIASLRISHYGPARQRLGELKAFELLCFAGGNAEA
ncbi:hypothetical protein HDU67_001350 [Dinochytrium kinnereticum]|nr:hypothetical protein HDU67_001350 [Dinochytrium kinnereticum]